MTHFPSLIRAMKANGTFTRYQNPRFRQLSYPGALAYNRGIQQLKTFEDIDQEFIDEQRRVTSHGIRLYMPDEVLLRHVRSFFGKPDWMNKESFLKLMEDIRLPLYINSHEDSYLWRPDNMTLDTPDRKTKNTKFTQTEYYDFINVIAEHPALVTAIMGYQAAHIDYLDRLSSAIKKSKDLNKEQRKRGQKVIANMREPWDGHNFLSIVLPAICLSFLARKGEDDTLQPDQQDFIAGMRFVFENDGFKASIPNLAGQTRNFKCPAMQFIARSTAQELTTNGDMEIRQSGMGLYCVYRQTKDQLNPETIEKTRALIRYTYKYSHPFSFFSPRKPKIRKALPWQAIAA